MEFLVRWAGYDESSNSWEPYKALMHVDKLHDYLREHRMRALIPREHKIFLDIFPTEIGIPLRFLVSETSHTNVYLLCVSYHVIYSIPL
jgi:hypothetical protein